MRNELQAAVEYLENQLELVRRYTEGYPDKDNYTALADIYTTALDTTLSALRDAQQRQPDPIIGLVPCEYCNGNRETQEVMPSDPDTIWTIIADDLSLSFINCNWGCEEHVVDINYCPMCGRKLEVEG